MEAVVITLLDQNDDPISEASGIIYDADGDIVTSLTSSDEGQFEALLPSSDGDGTLYYLRVYKKGYAFDPKYGFSVVTGEESTWTLVADLLELTPSLNPALCNIQGEVVYPDNTRANTTFKISIDDDIGAVDGSFTANSKEVTTTSGSISFELPRNAWVNVSSPFLPQPKFCHVRDSAYLSLLDFLLPIVETVISPSDDITLSLNEVLEVPFAITRTDGASVPAEEYVDSEGIEEYLKVEIDDEEIVGVTWQPSGVVLKGLSLGSTSIYFRHRDTRQFGPLLRLPQNTDILLEIQITVE